MLQNIKIVLIETSRQGNIGSTARAMKTMGLTKLCLVNPKDDYLGGESVAFAAGAADVLHNAQIFSSLQDALDNTEIVFGTSIRQRSVSIPLLDMKKSADVIYDSLKKNSKINIALVFGRENSGLNNQELGACNYHIKVPTNLEYGSLNLSQAVQIASYEIYQKINAQKAKSQFEDNLANAEYEEKPSFKEMEMFYEHLEEVLRKIEFIDTRSSRKLMLRFKKLYNKADVTKDELNILRGVLSSTIKYAKYAKK